MAQEQKRIQVVAWWRVLGTYYQKGGQCTNRGRRLTRNPDEVCVNCRDCLSAFRRRFWAPDICWQMRSRIIDHFYQQALVDRRRWTKLLSGVPAPTTSKISTWTYRATN